MGHQDIYVITYGPTRWGWKFQTGVVQKTYPTKDDAIFEARQLARRYGADLYVQRPDGSFAKLREPSE